MGSNRSNFKNFSDAPVGNFPLARQSSIYSLTFDELQNAWSGAAGKDFGSMNMDELLKNIWTAEETQGMTPSAGVGGGSGTSGNLQRQGSLTLPRTLSQKTVDEVWRDLIKEAGSGAANGGGNDGSGGNACDIPQRQQTLGEMTLEEFLLRAGVVREDAQQVGVPSNNELFGNLLQSNNTGLNLAFQQPSRDNGLFSNQLTENNNTFRSQPPSLAVNFAGARPSQQQRQPLFPKQTTVAFASPVHVANTAQAVQLPSSRARGAVGASDPYLNNNLVQTGGISMAGLGTRGVMVSAGSPANQMTSDALTKSSVDTSPISPPVPYAFTRGRRCGGNFEKVVERRQKRMIKNRESAARSRARKQAYTIELEEEVAKLKEVNEELQRKQEELMEQQKNQLLEKMKPQWGAKRQCLRRVLTGPW